MGVKMFLLFVFVPLHAQVKSHPLTPDEIETLLQNPSTLRKEYSVWKNYVV